MDLTQIIFLGATSLLSGQIKPPTSDATGWRVLNHKQISLAVAASRDVWEEVLRQERE
jgi:hypothetical protein